LRSHNLDKLRYAFGTFHWPHFLSISDVTLLYDSLLSIVHDIVSYSIPYRRVRMSHKDPPYITPLIKQLLAKRRKLRRSGRIDEASNLAIRINQLIADNQGKSLVGLVDATPKQLWAAVKPKQQKSNYCASLDADMVNIFFAIIATDSNYSVSSFAI